MNGFTNAILSMLLSWLRVLVINIWRTVSSGGGNNLYTFLSNNWLTLVIILCVGGFALDCVVYFFRWRPYYVWRSKLRRLRRGHGEEDASGGEPLVPPSEPNEAVYGMPLVPPSEPNEAAYGMPPVPSREPNMAAYGMPPVPSREPNMAAYGMPPVPPGEPNMAAYGMPVYNTPYARPFQADVTPEAANPFGCAPAPLETPYATMRYEPMARRGQNPSLNRPSPYEPPRNLEPVFDDAGVWNDGAMPEPPVAEPYINPSRGMVGSFGMPRPEPLNYLRDMQAGFEPPEPSEPTVAAEVAPVLKTPVHPGLSGNDIFSGASLAPAKRLDEAGSAQGEADGAKPDAQMAVNTSVPSFMPYAQQGESADARRERVRNPFANIAKKARSFVGGEDEDHHLTIHDLQPSVDMRSAFHEPVYPKPRDEEGGDF